LEAQLAIEAMKMNKFMKIAVEEAFIGVRKNEGGPFGAVIVKNNKVIAKAHNEVLKGKDSTKHAEITAIREACRKLGTYDLKGCDIYTSCEPCPMCLGAILWARIDKIYFGCTKKDAKGVGFDDDKFYKIIEKKDGKLMKNIERKECLKPFEEWKKKKDKKKY
jgi:guanine deaminase